jgi:hypothetical protein
MANIAFVFHWPTGVMDAMPLDELLDWQDRAIATWNAVNAKKEG